MEVDFVHVDGVAGSELVHEVEDAFGGERRRAGRDPHRRLPPLWSRSRRLGDRVGERGKDEPDIADDRVAHRRSGGFVGVAGDLHELRPGRQKGTRFVFMVAKHWRPGDHHQVMAVQEPGDAGDAGGQQAAEIGMDRRERTPRRRWSDPHRRLQPLREEHGVRIRPRGIDVRSEDDDRIVAPLEACGERGRSGGV